MFTHYCMQHPEVQNRRFHLLDTPITYTNVCDSAIMEFAAANRVTSAPPLFCPENPPWQTYISTTGPVNHFFALKK